MDREFYIIFLIVLIFVTKVQTDHEYMVTNAESRTIPFDFETKLQCIMNIEPDKFIWKFYPLPAEDAFNPKAEINLSQSNFIHLPTSKFTVSRKQSDLTLIANTKDIAGDYQCLAYYGASVVASIPWRITIAKLGQFPKQNELNLEIVAGNTVNWRCEPPESNPETSIDYYKDNSYVIPTTPPSPLSTKSLILADVSSKDSGKYWCKAVNVLHSVQSPAIFNLKILKNLPLRAPEFIIEPKKFYIANKGDTVFLECSAIGNPKPEVTWLKKNSQLPSHRVDMINGGLLIKNISSTDDGVYVCTHTNTNKQKELTYHITLIYNEEPSIDCFLNTTEVRQGEDLDLDCNVKGVPEPKISWFLNGYSIVNDSAVEVIGNRIYFRPTEKRHAGNLQIFARNIVKTVYSTISIKVIPLSTSIDVAVPPTKSHHRHNSKNNSRKLPKHTKMIPPTKPSISRLNDEAVVVRWSVPANKGLPIQFFKVQYRELGPANHNDHHNRGKGSRWKTTNADIPPHISSYEVNNLKPDHIYKFRIAAVYSNNDNKLSQNSDKFYLRKLDFDKRNPLPVPLITHTETINSTAVKIYWKYDPSPNITIDGFFINYISASSAADYMKTTIDGESTDSYILTHLQPDTVYDVKLQSFTLKSASDFSAIMKAKTLSNIQTTTISTIKETTVQSTHSETGVISKLYVIIAIGVIGGGVIILVIALLLFCRKWKQKKNRDFLDDRDKAPNGDDHHIQADSNDYMVNSKTTASRSNGCVVIPPNRITITANPLADADNKNQNMIEMSCLSSVQNNNCSQSTTTTTKMDNEDNNDSNKISNVNTNTSSSHSINKKNKKCQEKRIKNIKHDSQSSSSENYV